MRGMADIAGLLSERRMDDRIQLIVHDAAVALLAQTVTGDFQQRSMIGGVRIVAVVALADLHRLVYRLLGAPVGNVAMTLSAEIDSISASKFRLLRTVWHVAVNTGAIDKRRMDVAVGHLFLLIGMTAQTEGVEIFADQVLVHLTVRIVTGQAILRDGRMRRRHLHLFENIVVAAGTKLNRRL